MKSNSLKDHVNTLAKLILEISCEYPNNEAILALGVALSWHMHSIDDEVGITRANSVITVLKRDITEIETEMNEVFWK